MQVEFFPIFSNEMWSGNFLVNREIAWTRSNWLTYLSEWVHALQGFADAVCMLLLLLTSTHTHRILGLHISKMLIRHLYDLCHMWKVNSLFLFFLFLIRKMSPHYMASILVHNVNSAAGWQLCKLLSSLVRNERDR